LDDDVAKRAGRRTEKTPHPLAELPSLQQRYAQLIEVQNDPSKRERPAYVR
jgi:hypothetical protein